MTTAVPIRDGLFHVPPSGTAPPYLIGSRCDDCGRAFFPRKIQCPHCSGRGLTEIALSSRGTLYTWTVIHQAPPGYAGPVPYVVGRVELPEGERVLAPIVGVTPAALRTGMPMELVIGKAFDDPEKGEVVTYQFRPAPAALSP